MSTLDALSSYSGRESDCVEYAPSPTEWSAFLTAVKHRHL
ncbi:DUF397 domain-containing protein [Marinactinospora rubrisoli]|uniref:DUF397 domain-containing protein n=1 Tax=Marinactinospora rubrisoli TaxID=2715399 RepID=A0ABW2KEV9_9ACTN